VLVVGAVAIVISLLVAGRSSARPRGPSSSHALVAAGVHAAGMAAGPVLVRPVPCFAQSPVAAARRGAALPAACPAPYAATAASIRPAPDGSPGSYKLQLLPDDPALRDLATSAHDVGSRVVLLPFRDAARGRLLLGPAVLALSKSTVSSVRVVPGPHDAWRVSLQLTSSAAVRLDDVAQQYFHRYLAVDVGGKVVGAPVVEPAQSSFRSYDGKLDLDGELIGGLSGSSAGQLAAGVGR
jgi:hypothetical protein